MPELNLRSLRVRLLAAALISIVAVILITGYSLMLMFEHHVERRIGRELETYLNQITAHVELLENGRISFDQTLADPRFSRPQSGLYWQVQDEVRPTLLRSRSLWDAVIELPEDSLVSGEIHEHLLPGPAGQTLIVRERHVRLMAGSQARRLRIAVALDRQSLIAARNAFAADMLPYLAILVAVLLLAAWVQVRLGLAPLDALRKGVMDVRSGRRPRLSRNYPTEVMPLVDEMNGLLDAQEQTIERARAWTADLAHGLKTPLTVLTSEAQRLRLDGGDQAADTLELLAENMRRRVDRELVRARLLSGVVNCPEQVDLAKLIAGIIRTLQRIPGGDQLSWDVHLPPSLPVLLPPDDAAELLGNLLENAAKWAQHKVKISVKSQAPLAITIEDDGEGVPPEQLNRLGQRGLRLDEKIQGTGLGLAIALDIAEAYAGSITFTASGLGGLAVHVRL